MYVGYRLSRFANRHFPVLVRLSRSRSTPLRAAVPFLAVAVVTTVLAACFLRIAAHVGADVTGVLSVAALLYAVAIASCLLGDTMKREWHRKWRPDHYPDVLDDARFEGLSRPNRAVYVLPDGTRFVVRIRSADAETFRLERIDGEVPSEPLDQTAPAPPVGFEDTGG